MPEFKHGDKVIYLGRPYTYCCTCPIHVSKSIVTGDRGSLTVSTGRLTLVPETVTIQVELTAEEAASIRRIVGDFPYTADPEAESNHAVNPYRRFRKAVVEQTS